VADPITRAAFAIGQGARIGLYWSQYWLSARLTRPVGGKRLAGGPKVGVILADLRELMARDWRNVAAGLYRMPHDLAAGPLRALALAGRYFADLPAVERRRHRRDGLEVRGSASPGDRFPAYYLRNFHFQTDGYLSPESAKLYDHQVEVLFGGGADAMRRQALVPIRHFLQRRGLAGARLLDLGAGTGQFLTFVKDNYPRLAVTALELSPAYMAEARQRLEPWRGIDFVEGLAEASGLPGDSFDIVTAVFLFHELPRKVRRQVAAEIARLLRPGGLFVFVDSLQLGDRPAYDPLIEHFPHAFHEPYYADYVRDDLEALFEAAGLEQIGCEAVYFARIMAFRKPARALSSWSG